jgi:hypothetical protein
VLEGLGEGFAGAEAECIYARAAQSAIQFRKPLRVRICEFLTHRSPGGIHFEKFTRFRVLDREQARRWQRAFAWVVEVEANKVVPAVREAEFLQCITPRADEFSLSLASGPR